MYISELTLENFRGFKEKTIINFNEGINVIIGHNNAGKTSILKALELMFYNKRSKRLNLDDFNKNIDMGELKKNPPKIILSAKLTQSKNEDEHSNELVAVAKWLTKIEKPYEALITYEFFLPRQNEKEYAQMVNSLDHEDDYWYELEYHFLNKYISKIYVGNPEHKNVLEPDSIDKFDFQFLTAIRDVEKEMFSGRNSLLKEVINFFMDYDIKTPENKMSLDDKKKEIEQRRKDFSNKAKPLINSLHERMDTGKEYMLQYAEETGALFDNSKPDFEGEIFDTDLYSALKLIVEDKMGFKLPVTQNGLGYNNLIYISLLLAKIQKNASGNYLGSNAKIFSILAIEEPEAHLHPNMQYKFLKFLKENQKEQVKQIFVTSHSPNITAAVDLNDIIILHKYDNEIKVAYPGKVFGKNKQDIESKNYVQRFLDVTKADMFFAKSLILVEGISEQMLIPEFAKIINKDLTDSHVSVINIGGKYFDHFLKLFETLNEFAIKKKVACVTDLDPQKKNKNKHSRWQKCMPFALGIDKNYDYTPCSNKIINKYSKDIFIRVYSQELKKGCTFEYDIILANPTCSELVTDSVSNAEEIKKMMGGLKNGDSIDSILQMIQYKNFREKISIEIEKCKFDENEKITHIIASRYLDSVKKGAVAQELAYLVSENHKKPEENRFYFEIPSYICEAIEWVCQTQ